MINVDIIPITFNRILESKEWAELKDAFNESEDIFIIGHAGNLGIANYIALNITKHTKGAKMGYSPASATEVTLYIHDSNFDDWIQMWLRKHINTSKKTLVIGLSSSGTSNDVINALKWTRETDIPAICITAAPLVTKVCTEIVLDVDEYSVAESLTHLLLHELIISSGYDIYKIKKSEPITIREHAFNDEAINLAIDFDGVIHKNSKGFYDGTIYDDPIEGSEEALKLLASKYRLILYTAKAKPDRPLVNGKTGTQLVWEWLEKNNLKVYITDITAEKPRAVAYIDDKCFRFLDWESCMNELKNHIPL